MCKYIVFGNTVCIIINTTFQDSVVTVGDGKPKVKF